MTKIKDFMRDQYHQISPHFPRTIKPEDAKSVRLVDGQVENADLVFSPWHYVDDRFAAGGRFSMRHSWILLDKVNGYRFGYHDEEGNHHWVEVYGLVELIQFKSSSVKEICTIIGDLSRANTQECT